MQCFIFMRIPAGNFEESVSCKTHNGCGKKQEGKVMLSENAPQSANCYPIFSPFKEERT